MNPYETIKENLLDRFSQREEASTSSHQHPKGRSCERTDEVLGNYRKRAQAAELALSERARRP